MLTPAEIYLRTKCGLPPRRPVMVPDLDDPANRRLNTAEAAEAAHVEEATIRDWARRRLITAVNPGQPRPLYLELDVLRAEAATRRTARARRLAAEAAQSAVGSPNSSRA